QGMDLRGIDEQRVARSFMPKSSNGRDGPDRYQRRRIPQESSFLDNGFSAGHGRKTGSDGWGEMESYEHGKCTFGDTHQ
ncbi:MAG TPA: hypothetical protein VFE22_09425, partial [Edaphobacter sp.]|nr:hypothetical protein [Edaphobacter sp.]